MTREEPTALATSVADSAASEPRRISVTWRSDSALIPFGSGRRRGGRPQGAEEPVHLVLHDLVGRPGEPGAVVGVLLQLGAERRERERLEEVEHDALRDRVADDVGVPGRRHRDHVAQVTGRAQPLQQAEPVSVREVHVQQHEVDRRVRGQETHRLAGRPRHAGDLEAVEAADVGAVGLRGDRLVLHHQHPDRHAGAPTVTSTSAPPSGRAADADAAAVAAGRLAHQGQPHPAPDASACLGRPAVLEDALVVGLGDARPVVAHPEA